MNGFENPDQMVFACDHVFSGGKRVRLVVHDEDGKWTFMCGSEADNGEDLQYVPMAQVVGPDPTLESIAGLGEGMIASRGAVGQPWDEESLYEGED